MREAFRLFRAPEGGPYQPQLTIVVCGKRHHTRFYPTNSSSADDKGNPLPGTVVDRGVTAIYEEPENPDLVLDTSQKSIAECVEEVLGMLRAKQVIK